MMGKMLILQILLILSDLRTRPIDFLTQQSQKQHLTLTYTLCQMILVYICVSLQGAGTEWDSTPSLLPALS